MGQQRWFAERVAVSALSLSVSILLMGTAYADDMCHGRSASNDHFVGSETQLTECLNGGGISGLTLDGLELSRAIVRTNSAVRLRGVFISQGLRTVSIGAKRDNLQELCDGIDNQAVRSRCPAMATISNDFFLQDVESDGIIDLSNTLFLGNMNLTNVEAKEIWFDSSVFAQDLMLARLKTPFGIALADVISIKDADLANLQGYLSIVGGEFQGRFVGRAFDLSMMYVKKTLFGKSVHIDKGALKDSFIYESIFKSDVTFLETHIGSEEDKRGMMIADSEIRGHLDFRNVSIVGELQLSRDIFRKALVEGIGVSTVCVIDSNCKY